MSDDYHCRKIFKALDKLERQIDHLGDDDFRIELNSKLYDMYSLVQAYVEEQKELERSDWEYEQIRDRKLDEQYDRECEERSTRLREHGGDRWINKDGEPRYG